MQGLDYKTVSPQIGLKFADASTTLYAQSAQTTASYPSNILKYIRKKRAENPKELELALVTLFSDNEKESLEYATGVLKILGEEWGCVLSKVHVSDIDTLKDWMKSETAYPKVALLALDGKAGDRPRKPTSSVIAILVGLLPVYGCVYVRNSLSQSVVYADASKTHWLTSSSKTCHDKSCRWYQNSKGCPYRKDEERACKKCGGYEGSVILFLTA